MVKTENKAKIREKPKEIGINETKEQFFTRIAKPRVEKVLKAYRILGNCSNRSNYTYTSEQIDKIFETLHLSLEMLQNKFTKSKKELESFEFD